MIRKNSVRVKENYFHLGELTVMQVVQNKGNKYIRNKLHDLYIILLRKKFFFHLVSQLKTNCLKSTIETQVKGVKYFQSNNKNTRPRSVTFF